MMTTSGNNQNMGNEQIPIPTETVVVPPPNSNYQQQLPQNLPVNNGGSRRLKLILIILFVFLLLGVGGYFVYSYMLSNRVVTIEYWGLWEEDSTMSTVINQFEQKNPKIKVVYQKQSPRQYRERVARQIDNGEGPDVYDFHNTWVPMLANQLMTVPANVMTNSQFSKDFYPVANSDLVANGNVIYGIPISIDGLGLYYNEDIFSQKGVSPPVSWEDFQTLVPVITEHGEGDIINLSTIALGTTKNIENFSDILALMFKQNQANLVKPEGEKAEETLIFFRNFADSNNPTYYTWNDTMDNSVYAFATGKVAMIFAPSWRVFDIKQINPNLNFKIAPVPQLPGGSPVNWASYWVMGVSSKSRYSKESWEFVKYLTSSEGQTLLYTESSKTRSFGQPYSRIDLGSKIENDPYAGAFIKQAQSAQSFPLASRTFDNGLNDRMIKYLEDAVNGMINGSSPNEVLTTMSNGFTQVLSTYGLISTTTTNSAQ